MRRQAGRAPCPRAEGGSRSAAALTRAISRCGRGSRTSSTRDQPRGADRGGRGRLLHDVAREPAERGGHAAARPAHDRAGPAWSRKTRASGSRGSRSRPSATCPGSTTTGSSRSREQAKATCPVSLALAGTEITLEASIAQPELNCRRLTHPAANVGGWRSKFPAAWVGASIQLIMPRDVLMPAVAVIDAGDVAAARQPRHGPVGPPDARRPDRL